MKAKFQLLYLSILIVLISCKTKGEDSIYLVPKYYEGNLVILFNQKEGLDTLYENKKRIYRFDYNGVLKTKFEPNYGTKQHLYYYVDKLGNRSPLKYLSRSELKGAQEVVISNEETGNGFDTTKKVERHFELLTVGRQFNIDSIGNLRSSFMWELLK